MRWTIQCWLLGHNGHADKPNNQIVSSRNTSFSAVKSGCRSEGVHHLNWSVVSSWRFCCLWTHEKWFWSDPHQGHTIHTMLSSHLELLQMYPERGQRGSLHMINKWLWFTFWYIFLDIPKGLLGHMTLPTYCKKSNDLSP